MSTLARDALDHHTTPWLFATALATTAPHVLHQPLWLSLLAGTMLLWAAWLWWKDERLPGRWLLILLVVAGCAGILIAQIRPKDSLLPHDVTCHLSPADEETGELLHSWPADRWMTLGRKVVRAAARCWAKAHRSSWRRMRRVLRGGIWGACCEKRSALTLVKRCSQALHTVFICRLHNGIICREKP